MECVQACQELSHEKQVDREPPSQSLDTWQRSIVPVQYMNRDDSGYEDSFQEEKDSESDPSVLKAKGSPMSSQTLNPVFVIKDIEIQIPQPYPLKDLYTDFDVTEESLRLQKEREQNLKEKSTQQMKV